MTANDAAEDAPRPRRRRAWDVLAAVTRPRVGLMLAMGFSSGLPFMLIGNTLAYWLADDGIKLAAIGLVAWVQLTYSYKFVLGPLVDRVKVPLLGRLGRRRSWMLLAQVVTGAALVTMGFVDPRSQLVLLVALALAAAVGSATQDTAMNGWRIETAEDSDELGLLTAAYTLGYRFALILTESVILMVAKRIGWPISYAIYGAGLAIGIAAVLMAREPARADAVMDAKSRDAGRHPLLAAIDAIVGPFIAFFRAHGTVTPSLILLMITFYHLSDYMRGPMVNPYYSALHIDKDTVGLTRLIVGTPGGLIGIALGGFSALRLGNRVTLLIGTLVQPVAVALFAVLGFHGGDFSVVSIGGLQITAFQAVMAFDPIAIGYAGVALVTYMSSLTSLGYTATQYALLDSAVAFTGKFLKGFSGEIVEVIHRNHSLLSSFAEFQLLAAALGLPAILLCLVLVRRPERLTPQTAQAAA